MNNEFYIANSVKNFILSLDSMIINVPNKEKYFKEQIYKDSSSLLENVYLANYEKGINVISMLINITDDEITVSNRPEDTIFETYKDVANYQNVTNRSEYQKIILTKISMLDFYFEYLFTKKYISQKVCKKYCNQLTNIRRMIYKWVKLDE